MAEESLEDRLQSVDDPVAYFRSNDYLNNYIFPDEYTNWIEEQRAVVESCALVDQSYHMSDVRISGSDATAFLAELATNSFESIETGESPQAKNLLLCNPDGYVIADSILFYLDDHEFSSVGPPRSNDWLRYNASIDDRDVTVKEVYTPFDDTTPTDFRFQIQGPNALDVMEIVTDGPLPSIPFFRMDTISIDGVDALALAHGMADLPGLEIFGPYEHHDNIERTLIDAGEDYGLRRMGSKAYKTGKIGTGWFNYAVPAIYDSDEMADYREWLSAESWEGGNMSIGGSFVSDDITDYYMNPYERGQGRLVSFDHDFVGRNALEAMQDEYDRERVTFVWEPEDVTAVYASLFTDGDTKKYLNLPDTASQWSSTHYDTVLKDDTVVGLSKYPGYLSYEREMLSLGVIDREYSEPGTEVTFIWGESDSGKANVERHEQTEIRATVGPAPYVAGGKREM